MSKADLRTRIRAARRARSEGERQRAADALARQCRTLLPDRPAVVAAYLSMPTEPGTDAMITALLAAGHEVRVPRIAGEQLEWLRLTDDTELARGPMGIREPVGDALPADSLGAVDVVLLPGLAVDRNGARLGQGGGFYDRALSRVPSRDAGGPLRVIVLFDDEVLDAVPTQAHDCRVDAVLTPSGVTPRASTPVDPDQASADPG